MLLLWILWVHFLAVASPGPDFVVAVKNAIMYSRNTWMRTAVWFGLWIAVHVTYCALWLALIISQSIMIYTVIKLLWAAYLMWLWAKTLISKESGPMDIWTVKKHEDISIRKAIWEWFLTNVLNPKATLFFLWLFTMVISPTVPLWVVITACVMMAVNTTIWFCCVSYFFTNPLVRAKVDHYKNAITKTLWWALVALWVLVAFKE